MHLMLGMVILVIYAGHFISRVQCGENSAHKFRVYVVGCGRLRNNMVSLAGSLQQYVCLYKVSSPLKEIRKLSSVIFDKNCARF
ncbi:hypothetical protein M758_3G171600 [Ceratodon purpureus]|uniref:Secreted protein n=1 Tax=Ceratodon purpureus TaxID=3225 RepID=A0A8T0IN32_CERPU|nr:hypothetical protein KC19_3G176800 [Ceratodon purpureus]KAG0623394.1 hypothetical protein M758_3G171600 [Ceratodon purpureus]